MRSKSFSFRLSRKIIIIISTIFAISLALIALGCIGIVGKASINYSNEVLEKTINDIEQFLTATEKTTESQARTIEAAYRSKSKIDTLYYFHMLEESLSSNPYFFGMGTYYEPKRFDSKNHFIGIYANKDHESGALMHEWDDDLVLSTNPWDYFEEDWYKDAKEGGTPLWTSPFLEYMDTYYTLMSTYSVPMFDAENRMFGVCTIDIALDWLKEKLEGLKPYANSNIILADKDLNYICNPISEKPFEGSMYDTPFIPGMSLTLKEGDADKLIWDEMAQTGYVTVKSNGKYAFCVFGTMNNGWTIGVCNQFLDAFHDVVLLILILAAILILGIIVLYWSSRRIIHRETRPIVEYAGAASKITDGRFDVPIPEVNTGDEISELGDALRYMQVSVTDYIEQLKVTTSEKERLSSELNVARSIQAQMLCTQFPELKGAGLYASCVPAREVGGDLYDFFVSGDDIYFTLGDVSGKGVPAALLMAITIASFRAAGKKNHSMEEIVSLINDTFCKSSTDLMFVTLVVGKVNSKTGEVLFCNAGHNPMVLIAPDGKAKFIKARTNIACGVMPGFPYFGDSFTMEKGSRLLIYSDGITEAETAAKAQYGEDHLLKWASEFDPRASDMDFVHALNNSVEIFVNGNEPNDDRTILTISISE